MLLLKMMKSVLNGANQRGNKAQLKIQFFHHIVENVVEIPLITVVLDSHKKQVNQVEELNKLQQRFELKQSLQRGSKVVF